ncbi:MAG: methyltransferase domain-containing protein [candidate division WWE3 bacterium]|nr:methyltransferase domain-containing protein [candidate division WWE3 bacterium]
MINIETRDATSQPSLLNPAEIPVLFSSHETDLFSHDPKYRDYLIDVDSIPQNAKVLDIGSGRGQFVAELKAKGINAIGLDLVAPGASQKPDVAGISTHLPFANESFDIVTNYWGGLTYPLMEAINKSPEIQRQYVIAFLEELREAIRVSGNEIRIYPWSGYPFYEEIGVMAFPEAWGRTNFLAINFGKLFTEMGLTDIPGNCEPVANMAELEVIFQELTLKKSGVVNFQPLDDLVSTITETDRDLFFNPTSIPKELGIAMDRLQTSQGYINSYYRRVNDLEVTIKNDDFKDFSPLHIDGYVINKRLDPTFYDKFKNNERASANLLLKAWSVQIKSEVPELEKEKDDFDDLFINYEKELLIN